MKSTIDISSLRREDVLAALFNAARSASSIPDPTRMTPDDARRIIDERWRDASKPCSDLNLSFDYLGSKCLKIDLGTAKFDPRFYDRDNGGEGAAARALAPLFAHEKMIRRMREGSMSDPLPEHTVRLERPPRNIGEEVEVCVELRCGMDIPIRVAWRTDLRGSGFEPLPRDREVMPDSDQRAMVQRERRQMVAGHLAGQLARAIVKAVESRDPVNGYAPKPVDKISL